MSSDGGVDGWPHVRPFVQEDRPKVAVRIVVRAWLGVGARGPGGVDLQRALRSTVGPMRPRRCSRSVFGALMAASWIWPITLFVHDNPTCSTSTKDFFVLLILLVPPGLTVWSSRSWRWWRTLVKRRAVLRTAFNVGRVVTSAGAAALVFVLLDGPQHPTGYVKVGAALVGAASYFLANTGAIVAILNRSGRPGATPSSEASGQAPRRRRYHRHRHPDGSLLPIRPAFLPLCDLAPSGLLRYLGEGHFYARNDRIRLRGLFEATLDVNRSIGSEETRAAVLASAGSLLRSPDVSSAPRPHARRGHDAGRAVDVAERQLWLPVSGRRHSEPFDDGDRALLDAFASVGGIALSNADLYARWSVRRTISRLSRAAWAKVCARSPGPGTSPS